MKRVIVQYRLAPTQQFKMKIKEPGIIHAFGMGYEKQGIIAAPGPNGHSNEMAVEFPVMRVEIDPEGEDRERMFAMVMDNQIIESPRLAYIDSCLSQSQGSVVHLFEVFEVVESKAIDAPVM